MTIELNKIGEDLWQATCFELGEGIWGIGLTMDGALKKLAEVIEKERPFGWFPSSTKGAGVAT